MKHRHPEQRMAARIKTRSEQVRDALQLPADVMEGAVQIRVNGSREILIGNHRKLITYLDTQICLCGAKQRVTICGSNLCIPYYTDEAMRITGRIHSISLESLYE